MAPSSYQARTLGDTNNFSTKSQSTESNMSQSVSTVAQVLTEKGGEVFSVQPTDTIHEVVRILKEKRIGALVITDQSGGTAGHPVGARYRAPHGRNTGPDPATIGRRFDDTRRSDLRP